MRSRLSPSGPFNGRTLGLGAIAELAPATVAPAAGPGPYTTIVLVKLPNLKVGDVVNAEAIGVRSGLAASQLFTQIELVNVDTGFGAVLANFNDQVAPAGGVFGQVVLQGSAPITLAGNYEARLTAQAAAGAPVYLGRAGASDQSTSLRASVY